MKDSVLNYILEYSENIEARLLAVSLPVISKRVLLRKISEPELKKQVDNNYPNSDIFELLHRINYIEFHLKWIELFQNNNIQLQYILNNTNDSYHVTDSLEEFKLALKNHQVVKYTDAEIQLIHKNHKFEYQQMNISDKVLTTGSDRSKTFEEIKNRINFSNKSVLDIGCAYGFFCFESEKLQANPVIGTELKPHRFIGSNIIKQLTASKCDFRYSDIFTDNNIDKFDNVFLLNVIHHLPDPISALKIAASLTREVLVLEFPTLTDKKFLSTLESPEIQIDPSLPLIGVSLLEKQDQTFVFNKAAITRILLNNNKLFRRIDFIKSPISRSRLLAFCYK